MKRINADIKGLKFLVDMSKGYFLTTLINQALPFLLLPILTRYLTTAEYGNLSLFSFYFVVSNALVGSSIPIVVSKNFFDKEKEYIAKIVANSIYMSAGLAFIVGICVLCFYPLIKLYVSLPLIWLLMIPIGSFAFVIVSLGLTVLRNGKKVFHFGCYQISNTLINVAISLFLIIILAWSWHGRAVGIVASYIFTSLAMLVYLRKNEYLSFAFSKPLLKEIRRVVFPLIPNSLQLVIISQVGLFFMQHYFTKDLLGKYSLGFQLAFCIKLLIDTLSMSWGPFLYQQLAAGDKFNKLYVTRLLLALFGIIIFGALLLVFGAGIVLRIMTTPEYYEARQFVPWFSLGFVFYGMYIFLNPILIKKEQQKFIRTITFLSMAVMILSNITFAHRFGHIGISYAYCATYMFMSVLLIYRAQKVLPLPWFKALKIWK